MPRYVAFLRAVNVGGTGELGFAHARTFIASGNVVFTSPWPEERVRTALERALLDHAGREIGVIVRSAAEIAALLRANPFADAPGNQVMALFVDGPLPADPPEGVTGRTDETICRGPRAFFIHYPSGMGRSRLRIPCDRHGTARNMNTIARLTGMLALLPETGPDAP